MSKFPFVDALQIMYSLDFTDSIKDCVRKWLNLSKSRNEQQKLVQQ